jgi:RNA polymerase-binding transcription factor DksA
MAYSDVFLGEMKKRLEAEKAQLEKDLGSFGHKGKGGNYVAEKPEVGEIADENAQEVTEYNNELSVEPTLEKRLRRVNKALVRISDGSYGMCDGEPTSEERLEADPSAGALEMRDEVI